MTDQRLLARSVRVSFGACCAASGESSPAVCSITLSELQSRIGWNPGWSRAIRVYSTRSSWASYREHAKPRRQAFAARWDGIWRYASALSGRKPLKSQPRLLRDPRFPCSPVLTAADELVGLLAVTPSGAERPAASSAAAAVFALRSARVDTLVSFRTDWISSCLEWVEMPVRHAPWPQLPRSTPTSCRLDLVADPPAGLAAV